MNNETVNTQENTTAEQQERTFSQEEVNRIVEERLHRERSKYSDYDSIKEKAAKFDEVEEASKTELQKATEKAEQLQLQLDEINRQNAIREIRERVANSSGVPAGLLNGETEEACMKQAEGILAFAKPTNSYPNVADGGEVSTKSTMTKADIMAIKNEKERLKAIEENISLFN